MALGNLDINTMEKIDDFSPDKPMTQVPVLFKGTMMWFFGVFFFLSFHMM